MIHTKQEWQIGDCVELMREMDAESIDTIVTSPPYWSLRDYGVDGQIGMEGSLEEYHARLLEVTAECMRVLKPTGVMFWNHGDSYYAGGGKAVEQSFKRQTAIDTGAYPDSAPAAKLRSEMGKCMTMQNERLIIQMIDDQGWILRNRIIWNKPNGMPSSVTDQFSNKYEPVYMLVKSKKYWFDLDAVRVPHTSNALDRSMRSSDTYGTGSGNGETSNLRSVGAHPLGKNPGDVWTIPTQPYPESHFATFPTALVEPMIKAACPAEICPVCGMARERIVDREFVPQQDVSLERGIKGADGQKPMDKSNHWEGVPRGTSTYHTVGWTSCNCNAGWIVGTVLDPFCGSGTVLEVCRLLNRNAIGLELNPDYEPLIRERSMSHTPPLTSYFGGNE